ncbi:MAG: RICIN domain-containing protein, partial [Eggerthella sp.]|nr:RICIN domain-containing protein [Eggerthella sp.]
NQKWIIEQLANGSYIIKSVGNSKLVLDATGATPKIGANVSVWTANGGNNQKWNIKPA